jgi:DNA processing protein
MIKQGAKLVETPEDILEEFGFTIKTETEVAPAPRRRAKERVAKNAPAQELPESEFTLALQSASVTKPSTASWASAKIEDPDAARLLDALGHSPATLEILAERTEMDGATLQSLLLQLEMSGRIGALPGGRFARLER